MKGGLAATAVLALVILVDMNGNFDGLTVLNCLGRNGRRHIAGGF
jgi:hypothetical protein